MWAYRIEPETPQCQCGALTNELYARKRIESAVGTITIEPTLVKWAWMDRTIDPRLIRSCSTA